LLGVSVGGALDRLCDVPKSWKLGELCERLRARLSV